MNTSDFSVIAKNLVAELHGAKPEARKGGKKAAHEAVDQAAEKSGQPGKFPKLKLVKGGVDGQAPATPKSEDQAPATQPVVFDSLLAQMERKVLEDAQAETEQPSSTPDPQAGLERAAADGPNAAWDATPKAANQMAAPNLVPFKLNRNRTEAEPQEQAQAQGGQGRPAETAASASSHPAPQVTAHAGATAAAQAPGFGKLYSALNDFLSAMTDQNPEPRGPQPAAGLERRPLADHQAPDERGRDGQDQGANSRKPDSAATPLEGWRMAQANGAFPLAQAEGPSASAVPPVVTQLAAALKAELSGQPGASAAEQGPRVITVHLSPEGMGQLAIRLEKVDGALKVNVAAEHESTAEHLQSDQATLVSALEGLAPGFSASDLSFSSMNQQDGDFRQNASQNGTNSGVAGHGQNPNQQSSHEQSAPRSALRSPLMATPSLVGEAAAEPRAPGRKPGAIYL